ncbi:hypothetical protein ABIC28_002248 [Rhodococcus sp. PvR044]|uniref:hypothetical protein n=1 Tax=unclassified Rhodococcus (in: high G+C Gram-positive bacteria) TaxID=192944 RepID=UPI000BCB56AE|nr:MULTISPECIES: hypothetical protein [unclassified Rhodococcus (in: high G+C Gram-positive bacteria)]MBP1160265.1 hypothetical protein [Rhodococcus sp. PvR099]PTR42861.1 hypothetical protein C8K38_110160 [Rhodococcus sp. OK611]SNX91782.1 hypothetical protein SAMN05447004_11167 [Rhodococcus sp. OK270]
MQLTAHDQSLFRDEPAPHRVRSAVAIALAASVPSAAPALLVTGSALAGVLIAAFTSICVGLAAVMI